MPTTFSGWRHLVDHHFFIIIIFNESGLEKVQPIIIMCREVLVNNWFLYFAIRNLWSLQRRRNDGRGIKKKKILGTPGCMADCWTGIIRIGANCQCLLTNGQDEACDECIWCTPVHSRSTACGDAMRSSLLSVWKPITISMLIFSSWLRCSYFLQN